MTPYVALCVALSSGALAAALLGWVHLSVVLAWTLMVVAAIRAGSRLRAYGLKQWSDPNGGR